MWLRHPLDDILSSGAKVGLLRVLFQSPGPQSSREIARRAGVDPGHASRILRELALSGVLRSRDHRRVVTYEVSDDPSGIASRLRELFDTEAQRYAGAVAELASRVPEALSIILFGSEARGNARPGSDTDLLIVVAQRGEAVEGSVRDACLDIAARWSLALSWLVMDLREVAEAEEASSEFWRNVRGDAAVLHGRPLEALVRLWQRGGTT